MNEKTKAVVTIGYHYGEIPWGKIVRNEYFSKNLIKNRNITFYEIKNSNVKSGSICLDASFEVEKIIKKQNYQLWISIHCGFRKEKSKSLLSIPYFGYDKNIIEKAKKVKVIKVLPWEFMDENERKAFDFGIPYTPIDALFYSRFQNRDTFEEMVNGVSTENLENLLKGTLDAINIVYDLH